MNSIIKTHSLQQGCTLWLTGLSGSGKSTIAQTLKQEIDEMIGDPNRVFILDGDVIRSGLNKDLGFTEDDQSEGIRRVSEVSKMFAQSGQICIVALISPNQNDRQLARELHSESGLKFFECYVSTPLHVCEKRDAKGYYAKARAGIIKNFTGVSTQYEAPTKPDIKVDTSN